MPIVSSTDFIAGAGGAQLAVTSQKWFPPDGVFGAAYSEGAGGADVLDIAAARTIYRALVRRARNMQAADIAVDKAFDSGDATALATAKANRQALRAAPDDPGIDAATTTDALVALWPTALLGPMPA